MIAKDGSPLSPDVQHRLDAVTVDAEIHRRWPEYRVLAIVAEGIDRKTVAANTTLQGAAPLDQAEAELRARSVADWTTDPRVAEWMEAYAAFGAKPKKTSPSSLALLKRVDAGLPRIDPVTDLYNSISVLNAMPIGGEDFDCYVGAARLTVAIGDEPFDTIDSGQAVLDHPVPGEVIWRDDLGVTCRRWNWRQGVRTRITERTTTVLFLLEALGRCSAADLDAAGTTLITGLKQLDPSVRVGSRLVAAT